MSVAFHANTTADVARAIAYAQQYAPHRVPLLRAVGEGLISLCELTRGTTLPTHQLERALRPVLVLVGDDDGLDTGPSGWAARPRLAGWARHAFVHATGGDVPSYETAIGLALHRKRVVLIETGTVHVMAWHFLFARAGVPTLNLVPPNGGAHPVPVRMDELH